MPSRTFPLTSLKLNINSELFRHLEKAARESGTCTTRFASELLEAATAFKRFGCEVNRKKSKFERYGLLTSTDNLRDFHSGTAWANLSR